jgi:hypothetical protein
MKEGKWMGYVTHRGERRVHTGFSKAERRKINHFEGLCKYKCLLLKWIFKK